MSVYTLRSSMSPYALRSGAKILSSQHPESTTSSPNEILALLSVNRRISAEATITFYSSYSFMADPEEHIGFLGGIGDRKNFIKKIEIDDDDFELELVQQLLATLSTLPALQLVKIDHEYDVDTSCLRAKVDAYNFGVLDKRVSIEVAFKRGYPQATGMPSGYLMTDVPTWSRVLGEACWTEEKKLEDQ